MNQAEANSFRTIAEVKKAFRDAVDNMGADGVAVMATLLETTTEYVYMLWSMNPKTSRLPGEETAERIASVVGIPAEAWNLGRVKRYVTR